MEDRVPEWVKESKQRRRWGRARDLGQTARAGLGHDVRAEDGALGVSLRQDLYGAGASLRITGIAKFGDLAGRRNQSATLRGFGDDTCVLGDMNGGWRVVS